MITTITPQITVQNKVTFKLFNRLGNEKSEILTPNRKTKFLKSRENELNYEVIPSSERILENNQGPLEIVKDVRRNSKKNSQIKGSRFYFRDSEIKKC